MWCYTIWLSVTKGDSRLPLTAGHHSSPQTATHPRAVTMYSSPQHAACIAWRAINHSHFRGVMELLQYKLWYLLWNFLGLAFGLLFPLCLFRRKVNLVCLTLLIALEVQRHSCKPCNRTHQPDFTVSHTSRKFCIRETRSKRDHSNSKFLRMTSMGGNKTEINAVRSRKTRNAYKFSVVKQNDMDTAITWTWMSQKQATKIWTTLQYGPMECCSHWLASIPALYVPTPSYNLGTATGNPDKHFYGLP